MIVITFEETQFRAGADAAVFEKFEETAVAFVDAADRVIVFEFGVGEQDQAATAAAGGAFEFTEIAVRALAVGAQFGQKLVFEVGETACSRRSASS